MSQSRRFDIKKLFPGLLSSRRWHWWHTLAFNLAICIRKQILDVYHRIRKTFFTLQICCYYFVLFIDVREWNMRNIYIHISSRKKWSLLNNFIIYIRRKWIFLFKGITWYLLKKYLTINFTTSRHSLITMSSWCEIIFGMTYL